MLFFSTAQLHFLQSLHSAKIRGQVLYLPEFAALELLQSCLQTCRAVPPQMCRSTDAEAPLPRCWTPDSRGSTCTLRNSPLLLKGWKSKNFLASKHKSDLDGGEQGHQTQHASNMKLTTSDLMSGETVPHLALSKKLMMKEQKVIFPMCLFYKHVCSMILTFLRSKMRNSCHLF